MLNTFLLNFFSEENDGAILPESILKDEIVSLKKDLMLRKPAPKTVFQIVGSLPLSARNNYYRKKKISYFSKNRKNYQFSTQIMKEMEDFKERNENLLKKLKETEDKKNEWRLDRKRKKIKKMVKNRKKDRQERIKNGKYFEFSAFEVDFEKLREPSYDSDGKVKPKEKIIEVVRQPTEEDVLEEMRKRREELNTRFSHSAIKVHSARVARSLNLRESQTRQKLKR